MTYIFGIRLIKLIFSNYVKNQYKHTFINMKLIFKIVNFQNSKKLTFNNLKNKFLINNDPNKKTIIENIIIIL